MSKISFDLEKSDFKELSEFFHKNGYIILNNALSKETIQLVKKDLYDVEKKREKAKYRGHNVHKCFFENSKTMVGIIENSKIVDFVEYLIKDVPDTRKNNNSLKAHMIHNNAFIVPPQGRGQAPSWHVDDPLQQVIIEPGHELPSYIKLPVLVATYMIWLSDCETPENGPTYVVPGSHRFGSVLDPVLADTLGIPMCGKAGTAVLINSNLWHRGCNNTSTKPRETLQITFARRIIGHKFKTIMNYLMPKHVFENKEEKTLSRLGFLQGGAYS